MDRTKLFLKYVFVMWAYSILSGCSVSQVDLSATEARVDFAVGVSVAEQSLLGADPTDQDWGLALSGGGVRSALFQVGVMKALYDSGKMQDIDFVSAVSGGSYSAYWAYTNDYFGMKDSESSGRFGYNSYDPMYFLEKSCRLFRTSNFVGYPKLLWRWVLGTSPADYYEERIRHTFGPAELEAKETLHIAQLASHQSVQMPYLIINGTVLNAEVQNMRARLYEFTPLHQGNDYLGYVPWREEKSYAISRASAISGAAVKSLLKREVDAPNQVPYGDKITLSDGGHSENLGAIALIKRGVSNIIVSDAEMDSAFGYNGLTVLMREIIGQGYSILEKSKADDEKASVDLDTEFDVFDTNESKTGYRVFEIAGHGKKINMYYIKMRLPTDIMPESDEQLGIRKNLGMPLNTYMTQRLNANGGSCSNVVEYYQQFEDETNTKVPYDQWLDGVMVSYEDFLNNRAGLEVKARIGLLRTVTAGKSFFAYDFPHTTTADQTFYIDQAVAYIGLGMRQTTKLIDDMRSD